MSDPTDPGAHPGATNPWEQAAPAGPPTPPGPVPPTPSAPGVPFGSPATVGSYQPPTAVPAPPPVPPRAASAAPTGSGGDDGPDDGRPRPTLLSQAAAGGGILVALGLFSLVTDRDRVPTLAISLAFLAGGLVMLWWTREGRTATAGVAIVGLASIPFVTALVNPASGVLSSFGGGASSLDDLRNRSIGVLLLLAIIWLTAYLVGPGRRYGFFLGAALFALWLVPMTFWSISATADALSFNSPTFVDPTFSLDDPGSFTDDPGSFDGSGSTDTLDSLLGLGDPTESLPLKLGVTSLLFGGGYLAIAGWLDGQGQRRAATPCFAAAIVILWQSLGYLQVDLEVAGASALGIALGGVGLVLGLRGARRFTTWISLASIVVSIAQLVGDRVDSDTAAGVVLVGLGLVVAIAAAVLEGQGERPAPTGSATPAGPAPAGAAAPLAPGPGPDASTWERPPGA